MFNTKIVEARVVNGQIEEVDLGWCQLPEVPVEKRPPVQRQGEPPIQPLVIKINGQPFFVIGHTWDLTLSSAESNGPKADAQSNLILVVQAVPPMPSNLVRADASTMDQLERLVPPPGGRN